MSVKVTFLGDPEDYNLLDFDTLNNKCYQDRIQYVIRINYSQYLGKTDLTTLPSFSDFLQLKSFRAFRGKLIKLPDFTECQLLEVIICTEHNISYIPPLVNKDGYGCTLLRALHVDNNNLSHLPDLSCCPQLEKLSCQHNNLTKLPDLSKCVALKKLLCWDNKITKLPDLTHCVKLEYLQCSHNKLTRLTDLRSCSQLQSLICNNNQIVKLPDLSHCSELIGLNCSNNMLNKLPDLSKCLYLQNIVAEKNKILQFPDVSQLPNIIEISCQHNFLTNIDHLQKLNSSVDLFISDNFISFKSLDKKFIDDMYLHYEHQYHVNYLVTRIKRIWKRYHYLKMIQDNYLQSIQEIIVSFM